MLRLLQRNSLTSVPFLAGKPKKQPKAESPEWDPGYLEPLRKRRMMELEMNYTLQEILVYVVYLVVIVIISNGNRNVNSFYMKDQLTTAVVHGGLLCGRPDGEECDMKEEDFPKWFNPRTEKWEVNPYRDFMKVEISLQHTKYRMSSDLEKTRI